MPRLQPVFLDRTGRRARLTNIFLVIVALAALSGSAVVAVGIVFAPRVEALVSPAGESDTIAALYQQKHLAREPALVPTANRIVPASASKAIRLGFYTDDDPTSLLSLQRHADMMDGIVTEWLALKETAEGPALISTADRSPALNWIKQQRKPLSIYPTLSPEVSRRHLLTLLVEPVERARLIDQIAEELARHDFAGIVVDFAALPESAHRPLVIFLDQLKRTLSLAGRQLLVSAEPAMDVVRVAEIARIVDMVLVETHDQGVLRNWAGPVAAQGWFEQRVRSYAAAIPAAKLIFSIGGLGYDWDDYGRNTQISVQQAWDLLARHGARLDFHSVTLNPMFRYRDVRGTPHEVWYLDAVTVFNQAKAALATNPAGLALWQLGKEDPDSWAVFERGSIPDRDTLAALATLEPGYGVFESARGVLISASRRENGSRRTSYDEGFGLIVDQSVPKPPRQTVIRNWHAADDKLVALTFDDGPDPRFTPPILDILAKKDVPATFYMIGRQVLAHPEIARRIVAEGHDIGNHSYSHPDLFVSGPERVSLEVNATQRVFESQLGRRSILFRPPYAMMGYGYLEGNFGLAEAVTDLGYLFGGIDVDAFDYYIWTADQIARRVVHGVRRGKGGQAILFHDAGGDRSPTIAALPLVIDTLRADGYRFVTTHELAGLSRDTVMPPFTPTTVSNRVQTVIRATAMRSTVWFTNLLPILAIGATVLGMIRLAFIVMAALIKRFQAGRKTLADFNGSVAVLVPAYNEEAVVCKTIDGLLASTIAERIVVTVIDDGSTDRTSAIVAETYGADPRVRLYRKENGGKSAALNYGFAVTEADVIVAIDGDTILLPDAVERLIRPFSDPKVGAVAGHVVVGNVVNLLTRFQALEYIVGQNIERRAFELFNAIGVVPGAIGAWRREAVAAVGGYSNDTLAEDGDLTVSVERAGWLVVNEPTAVALTEAPETLRAFMKQRFRWMFGTLQVAWKHSGALIRRPTGVSMITLPNVAFQYLFTLLAPIMDLALLWALLSETVSHYQPAGQADRATINLLVYYWIAFQCVDLFTASVGLLLDGKRGDWRLLPLVLLQRFTYRQLLYVIAMRALLAAVKGTFVGWGKLVRTGRVVQPVLQSLSG